MLIHTHLPNGEIKMAEYTTEENLELLDKIKGGRFYRLTLWGYGGESEYMELTKAQFDFWKKHLDEHGDHDAVNYCVNAEDGDFEFEDIEELPEEMQFLKVEGEDYSSSWYESPTGFTHQWGVDYGSANLTIEEVSDTEYNARHIADVVDGEDLAEYNDRILEETDNKFETVEMGIDEYSEEQPDYVAQMWSAEKGTFFEAIIETYGEFDPKKLKIYTKEFPNGDDTISSIEYDGEDLDNHGGDTNGKGYSFHVWSNV